MNILRLWLCLLLTTPVFADTLAGDGFRVNVPTATIPQPDHSTIGKTRCTSYVMETAAGTYMVMYNDFPEAPKDALAALRGSRNGAMRDIHGEVESEKVDPWQGFPALAFRFTGQNKKMRGRALFVMVQKRIYQIVLMGTLTNSYETPEAEDFFGSFRPLP